MQNFMELNMKKKFRSPNSDIWGLGPKTSLGQFGPKAFGKGLIKPLYRDL